MQGSRGGLSIFEAKTRVRYRGDVQHMKTSSHLAFFPSGLILSVYATMVSDISLPYASAITGILSCRDQTEDAAFHKTLVPGDESGHGLEHLAVGKCRSSVA